MANKGSVHALSPTSVGSDFSAVLKQIFQQAQTEIEARDRNLSSHFGRSHSKMLQLPVYDDTYRHEPLLDPALSFISDILAEDDESATNHSVELNAYQAKASEMAALLSEDSPTLALKIEGESPPSPEDVRSPCLSEGSCVEAANACYLSYLEPDSPFFLGNFPEPFRNELLLNSLRGPVRRNTLNFPQVQQHEASSSALLGNGQLRVDILGNAQVLGPAQVGNTQVLGPAPVGNTQLLVPGQPDILGNGQLLVPGQPDILRDGQLIVPAQSDILGDEQLNRPIQGGSQDDIPIRSHSHKLLKSEKTGRILKPRKESSSMRKKGGGKGRSSKDADKECVELNDLLLQCSQAVGVNNTKRAFEILKKVRQHASPHGSGAERLAHYFAAAMEARFSGTGWPLYMGLLGRHPSSAEILKATYLYMASCPFVKAYHYFINQTILNVARGASKLHILELQVDGFQYPALLKALADRPGGPPQVHLIGIGFPHYSMLPAQTDIVLEAVQKTGRQLTEYAASLGVPFQYTAWAGVRDDLRMKDFVSPHRKDGEVLVVISASLLRYVMDDTLDSSVVRSKLLKQGRDINPEVYIQGIVTGSYSTPFFTRRFREALFHFESMFDMLDTFIEREQTDRLVFEGEILGKAILNIVACEGTEVVDRIDKYKHWQAVTEEVGFRQLPLDKEIKDNVQLMLKTWHKEYTVAEDSQYLLMGWKGRMLHAMSTWNAFPEDSV